jgi:predicted SAM-dependent methyltransferase
VFEHLSIAEAHKALDQCDEVMTHNAVLRLDVPDSKKTLELYRETGDPFYERALLGPRRDDRGYHLSPYTRESLIKIVEEHGFVFDGEEENIHFYPAFCLRFRKPGVRAPRDYVGIPDIPGSWKVLDIGPGAYPLPRADVYLDYDLDKLTPLSEKGKSTILADIQSDIPRIGDKEFDFVWISHCMEHLKDPAAAARTISRIGKRGCMIVPSAWKESLTNFEESGHLWQILPNPREDMPPIFIRTNGQVDRIRNIDVMKSMSRVLRTGPNRVSEEQRFLRKWWYQNEVSLDVVHFWENELRVNVIG